MLSQMKDYSISWTQFEACNADARTSFEKMCRWLFNAFFFDGKAILHSDPNNPGIEVLPVFHEETQKRISFQAKYFSDMDYEQIKHSARKTVEYYSGQVDRIYLYCNKDVAVTSTGYKEVVRILHAGSIEIVPITDQEILGQVMNYELIASYYFDHVSLSPEWLDHRLSISLESLGPRYNDQFNVENLSEEIFEYFLCTKEAASRINQYKRDVIAKFKNKYWRYEEYQNILKHILLEIEELEDVSEGTILNCLNWEETLMTKCSEHFTKIRALLEEKQIERVKAYESKDTNLVDSTSKEIIILQEVLDIPQCVFPESNAISFMAQQVMIVKGDAGVGKSQMFAVAAEKLLKENRAAILLLGGNYTNNRTVSTQTPEILSLNLTMDRLLNKLEGIAIQNDTYSYIFIDAINESSYHEIWKTGLHDLFASIIAHPHIKLAISVRSGYERIVLDPAINKDIEDGNIASMIHGGFRGESINATLAFLNYYGIPFLPTHFLQTEMTNPLFLKLFCEAYSGENLDMFTLFGNLIEKADEEAQRAVGITNYMPLLNDLVDELAKLRLKNNTFSISRAELFQLNFWNTYGLNKVPFVASLKHSGLLTSFANDSDEFFSLGYNLLEDFVCAKLIIKQYSNESQLAEYIKSDLLKIVDGEIKNYHNIDIFIIACGLFAERYHKECFGEIETLISDEYEKSNLIDRYLTSFLWRKNSSVNADSFLDFLSHHPVKPDTLFRVLIENSTKENHPLNAYFMHDLLVNMPLAKRDALWTVTINEFTSNEERVFQLITYFDEGNLLDGLSAANAELLLIVLAWLLTSSNRFLRDKASKAAIEILKHYFSLCKPLLQRFESVNDPYVIQRLYGIVFGACTKRLQCQKEEYTELAKYVYSSIFAQEFVYPDILLRDYARLILERWIHEFPNECAFIDAAMIIPPYRSEPIPTAERQEYADSDNAGFRSIASSMAINHHECPGLYGDFGRYTFQAALQSFDGIDIVNLYHYAMQYIRDTLGYDDNPGERDNHTHYYRYDRHDTRKIERIGKKYQWIAFYNILARVSDGYLIKEYGETPHKFEGPWEPYVRDFDPSLNRNSMVPDNLPIFPTNTTKDEFLSLDPAPSIDEVRNWTTVEPEYFTSIPSKLLIHDDRGTSWVVLCQYDSITNKRYEADRHSIGFVDGSQKIWVHLNSYFVEEQNTSALVQHISSPNYPNDEFPTSSDVYQLFNREYVWSSGYKSIFRHAWIDYEIETGKYRIEKEIIEVPDFENIEYDEEGIPSFQFIKQEFERKIPEDTIHIPMMPTNSRVLWEEQYDASQDESTAFYIPCEKLINYLGLVQKEADGYFYSKDGLLVCFDGDLSGTYNGLVIRTDFLWRFLAENNLSIVWACTAEKQYFLNHSQEWSTWKGSYCLQEESIVGKVELYNQNT